MEVNKVSPILTETEIEEFMYFPPVPNANGLIAYWRFDEPKGKIAADASPMNNLGQMMNFDPTKTTSSLWNYHQIDQDTVLELFAGYSPIGQTLTFELVHPTVGGDVEFNPLNQTYTYTPNANWTGFDSIVYIADDGIAVDTCCVYINPQAIPNIIFEDLNVSFDLKCYPVPASDVITISVKNLDDDLHISIYSVDGRLIDKLKLEAGSELTSISCESYEVGIYLLEATTTKERIAKPISIVR